MTREKLEKKAKKIENRSNRIWWTQEDVEFELGIGKHSVKKLIDEGHLFIYTIPGIIGKRYKREEVIDLPNKVSNAAAMVREANERFKQQEK